MFEALDRLRRADQFACAAAHHAFLVCLFIHVLSDRRFADRAFCRKDKSGAARVSFVSHDLDHLRDDVARALHAHIVADAHVEQLYLVFVMQRRVGDDDAADRHGMQLGDRRQRAGAPDLYLYGLDAGGGLLGGEFVGDRPARAARHETEAVLQGEVVNLVNDSVDVIAKRRALALDETVMGEQFVGGPANFRKIVDRQSEAIERLQRLMLRGGKRRADFAPGIGEELQRSLRRHARIELAQRSCGAIARVGERGLAGGQLALVDVLEIGLAEINLTAHFEPLGRIAFQRGGDRLHGADVGGDVLALIAVAARRRAHQLAAFVKQRAGEAVDLGLGDDGQGRVVAHPQKPAHAGAKLGHVGIVKNVAERKHRHGMLDLGEFLRRRRADLSGWRFRARQRGMIRLQRVELAAQGVVIGVGDRRRVFAVIAPIMFGDRGDEACVPGAGRCGRFRLGGHASI